MTWTVILENGEREGVQTLSKEFTISSNRRLNEFVLIQYLDPFGDTTFNKLQMSDLIKDLNGLKKTDSNELIDEICELAERCKSGIHLYLTFYGD